MIVPISHTHFPGWPFIHIYTPKKYRSTNIWLQPSENRTCMSLSPGRVNMCVYTQVIMAHIWVNYNISLTWIKAIWGWFPLLTIIPSEVAVRSLQFTHTHINAIWCNKVSGTPTWHLCNTSSSYCSEELRAMARAPTTALRCSLHPGGFAVPTAMGTGSTVHIWLSISKYTRSFKDPTKSRSSHFFREGKHMPNQMYQYKTDHDWRTPCQFNLCSMADKHLEHPNNMFSVFCMHH